MALRTFNAGAKRIGAFLGIKESVQNIPLSGAASAAGVATLIKPYGVTLITSTGTGGPHRVMLSRPQGPGIRKTIGVKLNSTADVIVVNRTTSDKFWGSTVNSALFSTAAGAKGQGQLVLMSVSTAQWMLAGSQRGTTAGAKSSFVLQNSSN